MQLIKDQRERRLPAGGWISLKKKTKEGKRSQRRNGSSASGSLHSPNHPRIYSGRSEVGGAKHGKKGHLICGTIPCAGTATRRLNYRVSETRCPLPTRRWRYLEGYSLPRAQILGGRKSALPLVRAESGNTYGEGPHEGR